MGEDPFLFSCPWVVGVNACNQQQHLEGVAIYCWEISHEDQYPLPFDEDPSRLFQEQFQQERVVGVCLCVVEKTDLFVHRSNWKTF